MFSIFFVPDERQVRDYDDARTQDAARYTAFFHALLARGVYLPPSAFEAWFVSAALAGEALDRVLAALPAAARAAAEVGLRDRADRRPPAAARRGAQPRQGPLRPAARLPAVRRRRGDGRHGGGVVRRPRRHPPGVQPARARPADRRADRRRARRCPVDRRPADRGRQRLRGAARRRRRTASFGAPRHWWKLRNPFRPSWGEPYVEIAARMLAAVEAARDAARGHEAVLVSHQLPIWTLRLHVEGRRYAHDPRRRQCGLASVTSVTYDGDRLAGRRLRRARRCHRPRRGARRMRRVAAALAAALSCSPAARPATTRSTSTTGASSGSSPARRPGRSSPRTSARRPRSSPAPCWRRGRLGLRPCSRGQVARAQLLGLLVRALPGGDAGVQRGGGRPRRRRRAVPRRST